MSLNAIKNRLLGSWKGTNNLYLSWMIPQEYPSAGTLHIAPTVGDKFLALNYTWSHEDQPQEGLILVGYEANKGLLHASWVDSWHSRKTHGPYGYHHPSGQP